MIIKVKEINFKVLRANSYIREILAEAYRIYDKINRIKREV